MPTLLAPLASFRATDLATVGGKAANLGELLAAGFPVPEGFVVTTAAYAEAARRAGVADLLEAGASPARLRAALAGTELDPPLAEAVLEAYHALGDAAPVAVRSSATAEDLPGAAFAGQQDTYLDVVGDEAVLRAVRDCWASLWTDRAVSYRRDRAVDPEHLAIAVVIQAMVPAGLAGVLFTADPVSGRRDHTVVDAVAGLGEALVSGTVTPDHYLLDRRGQVVEWTSGTGAQPLLDGDLLAHLAAVGARIAAHFGAPQDVEWAVVDGEIRITQARPMTALPSSPRPMSRAQRLQLTTLGEYLPVRPYPLDMTTQVGRGPAAMMRDIAAFYGISGAFTDYLREENGVAVELVPPSPRPTPKVLLTPWKILTRAARFSPGDWADDRRQARFEADVVRLDRLDLRSLTWSDLLRVPDRALDALELCRDLRIDYLPGAGVSVARLGVVCALLGRPRLLADLVGGAPTLTEASNRSLASLAALVRDDPQLSGAVLPREPEDVLAALDTDPSLAGFRDGLAEFLREFGRRETVSPLLVSPPTLAESPGLVVAMVQSLASAPPQPDARASRSEDARRRLFAHPVLRLGPLRRRVERWLKTARDGVAMREDTHFWFTAALPPLRRSLLEIGRRLVAVGLLDEPFDVFHLRWDEISAVADPARLTSGHAASLRAAVRDRAAERARLGNRPLLDTARVFPAASREGALATGTAAGAGVVTATARVVLGPDQFGRLRDGEVLVCPYTNPAWTPLFHHAAAVVVDSGSLASHAAIVAREYGIPAVMGTGTGTSSIPDGALVTVDGTRGLVTKADGHVG